jgi:hypothetical protein
MTLPVADCEPGSELQVDRVVRAGIDRRGWWSGPPGFWALRVAVWRVSIEH